MKKLKPFFYLFIVTSIATFSLLANANVSCTGDYVVSCSGSSCQIEDDCTVTPDCSYGQPCAEYIASCSITYTEDWSQGYQVNEDINNGCGGLF